MKPNTPRTRGFTLIELVIVTVVTGIMAAVLTPLVLSSLKAYDTVEGDVVVLDKLRYATERLAREIREVKYDPPAPAGTGSGYAFGSMGANSLAFTRTFHEFSGTPDATVTVGNTGNTVTLAYSSPIGGGTQVLTDELGVAGNLRFRYYELDGSTETTDKTSVRYVQIELALAHTVDGVINTYPQRTRVELKNR